MLLTIEKEERLALVMRTSVSLAIKAGIGKYI
jgi:hypothetical protein